MLEIHRSYRRNRRAPNRSWAKGPRRYAGDQNACKAPAIAHEMPYLFRLRSIDARVAFAPCVALTPRVAFAPCVALTPRVAFAPCIALAPCITAARRV